MFQVHKTLVFCLTLSMLVAGTADAITFLEIDPGTPGEAAQDFNFGSVAVGEDGLLQVTFTDNKTLEWTAGSHFWTSPGQPLNLTYVGAFLDAKLDVIPTATFAGQTTGVGVDLSPPIAFAALEEDGVFSGLLFSLPSNNAADFDWVWGSDAPRVGEGVEPPPSAVDLTGTVEDASGTPLCALALASGQFMFTCNPNGPYSLLDLPTETDGSAKRQVYVDGFFPNVETLTGSTDETVVMTRAGNCPDYNSFPEPGVFPDSAGKRIDVSGTVLQQNTQTPVCAMVLGNGQFDFTCDGTGTYSGNIPLDTNGQYKLQVYAEGFAPMVQAFDEFSPTNEVRLARATECQ